MSIICEGLSLLSLWSLLTLDNDRLLSGMQGESHTGDKLTKCDQHKHLPQNQHLHCRQHQYKYQHHCLLLFLPLERKASHTLVTNWPNIIISININGNNDLKIEININISIIISWCKYSNSLSGKHRESHRGDKLSMSGKWVKRLTLYFSVGIQECLVRAWLSRKYSPLKYKPNS